MSSLRESVQSFHEAVAIVEAAMRMVVPYDFVADSAKAVDRFETAYRSLKTAAMQTMQGGSIRGDVQGMLADCANLYREYTRKIAEEREPEAVKRRRKATRTVKREAEIDQFALAEVMVYWQRDTHRRG